jgi:arsenate reductase
MKLYQYPKCSTCRKAIAFLNANDCVFESIDIAQQPPDKETLKTMLANYDGEIRKLFNTSGMQYRELNLKAKLPSMTEQQAIDLLAGNGMLIKRPFLLMGDGRGRVGFKQAEWEALL